MESKTKTVVAVAVGVLLFVSLLAVVVYLRQQNALLRSEVSGLRADLSSWQQVASECRGDLSACEYNVQHLSDELYLVQMDLNDLRERYASLRQDHADTIRFYVLVVGLVSSFMAAEEAYMYGDCDSAVYNANYGLAVLDKYESFVRSHKDLVRRIVSSQVYKDTVQEIGGKYNYDSIYSAYMDATVFRQFFYDVITSCRSGG